MEDEGEDIGEVLIDKLFFLFKLFIWGSISFVILEKIMEKGRSVYIGWECVG